MKTLSLPVSGKAILLIPLFMTFFACLPALSQEEEEEDKTLSPYFFVMSPDTSVDQMPLKSTSAEVTIIGVIANVSVKQTYCNEGDSVLEAIYVFPASTRAAVHYMQMSLGNRILIAQIKEKEEAQQIYEEAKEEGKTVTLLEQERPNVFKMSVGNILPGDTIEVEMRYTELLIPVEGKYEFVYPTVVGPRYVSPSEDGEGWTEMPYQHAGEEPMYDFHFDVCIHGGMEIRQVYSTSHPEITFSGEDPQTATASADLAGNKDVVIQYILSGAQIETGLLAYEGEEENFFLAMFQPPENPQDYQIPPREYVFIMDVSGSMRGFPIEVSKSLLTDLVGGLREYDRFNLVFFAGGNYLLAESSLLATPANIAMAINAIDSKTGGGGTELLSALNRALSLPGTEEYSRTFVIATDGYVSVERQSFDLIRNNLGNANFFAFGIGSSCNRYIIEGIAHAGMGEPFVVLNGLEAEASASRFRKYIQSPVLTNIDVDINGFAVYDVEPPAVPDVFAERPVLLFGKYNDELNGVIKITGLSGKADFTDIIDVKGFQADPQNEALRYLWARYKIQLLDDYGRVYSGNWQLEEAYQDSIKQVVTELGLKYNLLTQYTSFVAVDSIIRADSGSAVTVKQPLPMPEGVPNEAIGDAMVPWGGAVSGDASKYVGYLNNAQRSGLPEEYTRIESVFPNPFSSMTRLWVYISPDDRMKEKAVKIFNELGQVVGWLEIELTEEGWHKIEINFSDRYPELAPGVYSAVLQVGERHSEPVRLLYLAN